MKKARVKIFKCKRSNYSWNDDTKIQRKRCDVEEQHHASHGICSEKGIFPFELVKGFYGIALVINFQDSIIPSRSVALVEGDIYTSEGVRQNQRDVIVIYL